MPAEIITSDADPQLRRNSLGLPELVFQGVTHIAPATNIVFTFPIIALKAGPDMPLSFLLSTHRLLLHRKHGVAIFPLHAIERRVLFLRYARIGKPQRLHGDLELLALRDLGSRRLHWASSAI